MEQQPEASASRAHDDARGTARTVRLTAGLLGIAGAVCVGVVHPGGFAVGLLDAGLRVAFWSVLLVSAARLAAWLVGSRLGGLSHLAWDGIAGLALLAALLLAVGLMPSGFRAVTLFAVIGAVIATAAFRARTDPVVRFRGQGGSREAAWLLLVLAVVAVAGLAWDRVPPVFFDSLAYHFAQPELWLAEGRIAPEAWSLHSWFPPGMSVLYGVGLLVGGPAWANDANLLLGLLLLTLAFDVGRRTFGAGGGLVATSLLLTFPIVLYALAIPGADLGHGAFTFASLAALLLRPAGDGPWLRRAGICAAGAVLTKYLGFVVPLAAGALLLAWSPGAGEIRIGLSRRLRQVLLFVVPALVLVGPWLAANAVVVGNPVAPAFSEVWSTRGLADGGAESFERDARGGRPGVSELQRLGPRLFLGDESESRIYPTPAWGWVPVLLVPLVPFAWRRQRRLRPYLILAALLFLLWFLTFRWERFLVATTALLAVALAGAVVAVWRRGGPLRVVPLAAGLVGVLAIGLATVQIGRYTGGVPVALGQTTARDFLEHALSTARLYRRAAETLDRSSRILLLGEMRHYGLGGLARCAPTGFNVHPLIEALGSGASPEEINRRLRGDGYTHLIVDPGWVERSARQYPSLALLADRPELLQRYLGSLGAARIVEGHVALFRIPP